MPDQLTSVRIGEAQLAALRECASLNDSSVAAEIRAAIDQYLETLRNAPDFQKRLQTREAERQSIISALLAKANAG